MSNERYIKLGHLEDLRRKLAALEDRAEGIIDSIRGATFIAPLASPFDLDADKVRNYAAELREVIGEGNRMRVAIDRIEEELGQS